MRKWGSGHRPELLLRSPLVPKASRPPDGECVKGGPGSERSEAPGGGEGTHGKRAPSSSVCFPPCKQGNGSDWGPQASGLVHPSGGGGGQLGGWGGNVIPHSPLNLHLAFQPVRRGLSSPGAVCLCVQILSLREKGAGGSGHLDQREGSIWGSELPGLREEGLGVWTPGSEGGRGRGLGLRAAVQESRPHFSRSPLRLPPVLPISRKHPGGC